MGWKQRKSHVYYYKCERVKGRVRTRYYGRGPLALLACVLDVEEAEEREAKRRAEREWREQFLERERPIVAWWNQVEQLARAVLFAVGCHQHARGCWRKRRGITMAAGELVKVTKPAEMTRKEFAALVRRAERGDESCLPQLRAVLRAEAAGERLKYGLLDYYGSSQAWLHQTLRNAIADENLLVYEAIPLHQEKFARDLAGPSPSPLEELLARRVALCHFMVHYYECLYIQAKGLTITQSVFFQKRIDAANKRFLMAVRTLATVKKLGVPNLLVALGQNQQFNLGAGQPPPT